MSTPRPLLGDYPVRPWCELGVGDTRVPTGQARWDVSRWDDPDALWAGTEPTWLDTACETIDATANAGRERIVDRFRPGGAEVTVRNRDGWADMTGVVDPAALTLRPGRQLRFGVDTPTGRHLIHRGYIDQADPLYQPYGLDVVELTSLDALGEVGRLQLAPLTGPVGDGETGDVRIARILDALQWPVEYRDIQPASGRVQATRFGAQVANLLGITADSVGGSVFGDLAGRLAFRPRDWQTYTPDTPPAATIGNVGAGDVCPSAWSMSWARGDVAAWVRMANLDGSAEAIAYDVAAAAAMGPEPFERADLIASSSGQLDTIAQRVLVTRGMATMPRVRSVVLDAARDPGDGRVVELMATARAETPTRVRCRLAEAGRLVFDREMFITGTAHTLTSTGRWWVTFALDVAAPFAAPGGRWDVARWDRATWTGEPP